MSNEACKEWLSNLPYRERELRDPDFYEGLETGWRAALEWASQQCEHLDDICIFDCGCFSMVQNKIDEELDNE